MLRALQSAATLESVTLEQRGRDFLSSLYFAFFRFLLFFFVKITTFSRTIRIRTNVYRLSRSKRDARFPVSRVSHVTYGIVYVGSYKESSFEVCRLLHDYVHFKPEIQYRRSLRR